MNLDLDNTKANIEVSLGEALDLCQFILAAFTRAGIVPGERAQGLCERIMTALPGAGTGDT